MRKIDLNQLEKGLSGITPTVGSYLSEATIFALTTAGHRSGVVLKISGDLEDSFKVEWQDIANEDVSRSWNDEQELTEYAAVGIALPLILQLTSYTTFKRARKGDGMDYWLGREDKNGLPILEALLEVSGIFKENESNTVESRVGLKKKQLKKSAYKSLPGYVVVVEFGVPKSKFVSI